MKHLPVYANAHAMWSFMAKEPKLRGTAFYNLGVVDEKAGDLASAVSWYEQSLRATGHCPAFNNLGAIFFDRGKYDQAHRFFLKGEKQCPDHPGISYNLGLSFLRSGNIDQARSQLKQAIAHGQYHGDLVSAAKRVLEEVNQDPRYSDGPLDQGLQPFREH